jgi:hypothetical protein
MNVKLALKYWLHFTTDLEILQRLQRETFDYFIDEKNCNNGLIADKTEVGCPSSIAVIGLSINVYIIGVERGYISREEARRRILQTLRFLHSSQQGPEPDATGYRGFYYHFLNIQTGKRMWECELSTIDTAILIAGILTARHYFTLNNEEEEELRLLGDMLYERVDWDWARNGGATLTHGWTPETGFYNHRWNNGYSEAHILYILALGSPTHPISEAGYQEWLSSFEWKKVYDIGYIYAGPLFIHQMSQLWLDFRGIYDSSNTKHGIDYFENSCKAVRVHYQYALKNPMGFGRYGKYVWGLTASDGPGPASYTVKGVQRTFYDYIARGAPDGPDDGTISPWVCVTSLPFAPDLVLRAVRFVMGMIFLLFGKNKGFQASFNATFPKRGNNPFGWLSPWQFGLNNGPVVIMIENYQSGHTWKIFKECPHIITGLRKAGFKGGWLEEVNDSV